VLTGLVNSRLYQPGLLSLLNNDEVNAVILSREFAVEMEKMFAGDLDNSSQIQWDEMEKKTLVAQDQGVVCEFISRMAVTFRRHSFSYRKVNQVNQMHKIRSLPKSLLFMVRLRFFFLLFPLSC